MREPSLVPLAALLAAACAHPGPTGDPCARVHAREAPPPALAAVPKDAPVRLRALYLEDPRVPRVTAEGRRDLYRRVEALVRRWYGYDVRIEEVGARGLAAEFARPGLFDDADQEACLARARLEPATRAGREALRAVVDRVYRERGPAVFGQAFPGTESLDEEQGVDAVSAFFARLYGDLAGLRVKSGPLLKTAEEKRMYSFLHWAAYARWTKDADLVFTNATMIEADGSMPLYVLARGGVTTGVTDNNPAARYGAASVVTLLPFVSGERFARPDAPDTPSTERLDAAATMCLHELGHLLLRYDELYGEPGCVHSASTKLDYFEWHRAIRGSDNACPRKPGTVERF